MSKRTPKKTAIQRAVDIVGTQVELARILGQPATPALVWQWFNDKRPVAAKWCIAIEAATGGKVTRYELCPQVFGVKPEQAAA